MEARVAARASIKFCIVHEGLVDAEPQRFRHRSAPCSIRRNRWFGNIRPAEGRTTHEQEEIASSASWSTVHLPPLADMSDNRQAAVCESVWPPRLANSCT